MKLPMRILVILLSLCLLLSGCKKTEPKPAASLTYVTAVEVSYRYRNNQLHRSYTQCDKMDVILYYLYHLTPEGQPDEDPEQILDDICKITVTMSNGQQRIYRQIGSRYLSIDSHRWQKIQKSQGSVLYHLINHMQSDG